ncbi:MAG TPA: hypothetical protein VF116_22670 [Ktedonobacterales bacterium]
MARERPHDKSAAELVQVGEPMIVTIEAECCWDWGANDPATLAAVQAALNDLARAANRQAASIRAAFARIAERADALAAAQHEEREHTEAHATVVCAGSMVAWWDQIRAAAAARWAELRAFLRAVSWPEPTQQHRDLMILAGMTGAPADDRARGEAATRWARRLAPMWRVFAEDQEALRIVAQGRRASEGTPGGQGGQHDATLYARVKEELLQSAIYMVIAEEEWRTQRLTRPWRKRLDSRKLRSMERFESWLAERGETLSANWLSVDALCLWIDRHAITEAERDLRERAYGVPLDAAARDRAPQMLSLDAQAGTDDDDDDPRSAVSQASRAWARSDPWALSRAWEREQREEEEAGPAVIEQACRDAGLTTMQSALLDAVLRNGGDHIAAAQELEELTPGAGRTQWHRIRKRMEPILTPRLAHATAAHA